VDCFDACHGSSTPRSPSAPHQDGSEGVAFSQTDGLGAPVERLSGLNIPTRACRSPTLRLPPRDDRRTVRGESGWLTSFSAGTFTRRLSTGWPGAPRVASLSLLQTCRRHYPDGNDPVLRTLAFPDRQRPSPNLRRVGSRIALFEACSAFTRVPACLLAKPPNGGPLTPECFRLHRYIRKPLWLLPTEATRVGWDLNPLGQRAFPRRTD